MEKNVVYIALIVAIGYLFLLLFKGISALQKERKKRKRQRTILGIIRKKVSTLSEEESKRFVRKHIPMIMSFSSSTFVGKEFETVRHFLDNIGFDYNEEQSLDLLLYDKFTQNDVEQFFDIFMKALKKTAV